MFDIVQDMFQLSDSKFFKTNYFSEHYRYMLYLNVENQNRPVHQCMFVCAFAYRTTL